MFVERGLSDDKLPLVLVGDECMLCLKDSRKPALPCTKKWRTSDREYFNRWQYRLNAPFPRASCQTRTRKEAVRGAALRLPEGNNVAMGETQLLAQFDDNRQRISLHSKERNRWQQVRRVWGGGMHPDR